MIRPRLSFVRLRALPATALAAMCVSLCLAALPAHAQTGGYLPPPQNAPGHYGAPYGGDAPRSIAPPPRGGGAYDNPGYGQPYTAPPSSAPPAGARGYADGPPPRPDTYSSDEIIDTGHRFFGNVSEGLAKVVEYAFSRNGRPTGYILGEEAGGALVAGLRYGEGTLYTKIGAPQKAFWQGPSLGYDFGADGSKVLTLVYNLRDPSQLYERFGGVDGSAYLVGGAGITFQQRDDVVLAPIRAGMGLRLGANVGYLKYTRAPTWNPF